MKARLCIRLSLNFFLYSCFSIGFNMTQKVQLFLHFFFFLPWWPWHGILNRAGTYQVLERSCKYLYIKYSAVQAYKLYRSAHKKTNILMEKYHLILFCIRKEPALSRRRNFRWRQHRLFLFTQKFLLASLTAWPFPMVVAVPYGRKSSRSVCLWFVPLWSPATPRRLP